MLDAHPAADASARPQLPPGPAPLAGAPQARAGSGALIAAARTLLPVLEAGRPLDAATLRAAMTGAFGASDAEGAWVWKDAYEAAEAAAVLFLQRYGRAMRRQTGAGTDGPRKMLAMLAAIAALEPSHTKRSEQQIRLQQFSTPLPLALCRAPGRRHPPGRFRARAFRRHRDAGRHGPMRAREPRPRPSPSQRDRRCPRRAARRALSRCERHPPQRRSHRRLSARPASRRRAHEPAVLGNPQGRPHPPRRRSAPPPLGLLDAAAGRPARRHHLGPLRAGRRGLARRLRLPRRGGARRLHYGHRRTRLCPARHRVRHPAHRPRPQRRARHRRRPRGTCRERGRAARCRHRGRPATPRHRGRARRRSLRQQT